MNDRDAGAGQNTGAIDREHLDRHTFGNRPLQREVLQLFERECTALLERIRAATTQTDRCEAAHRLVGAARGVGAFHVADVARTIEQAPGSLTDEMVALERAIDAVQKAIPEIIGD